MSYFLSVFEKQILSERRNDYTNNKTNSEVASGGGVQHTWD